jgi:DNA-binding transcriptional LysR family regulator
LACGCLNRTTRAVSLTDAGLRFLERSRRILADLEDAEQMAESERGEPMGRLVVTAPQVFGRLHVAPLICEFMTRHPKVSAELMLSDRNVNLVEDGIDLAIRIGHLADSSDIVRKVGAVRRVLVASPDYLCRPGRATQHRRPQAAPPDFVYGTDRRRSLAFPGRGNAPQGVRLNQTLRPTVPTRQSGTRHRAGG